jgi:outer membrane receptor protein involved in Fe transport
MFFTIRILGTTALFVASVACVQAADMAEVIGTPIEIRVSEKALSPGPGRTAFSVTELDARTLSTSASPRLDDVLKAVPGATLFRRSSSRVSHPTSQGISLRGIGPNGAGRTLVLLDGVPQNDPFGGWIYWSAMPAMQIADVDVIKGGGAGSWGSAALSGTMELTSRAIDGTGARFDVSFGAKDTISLAGEAQAALDKAEIFAGGQFFKSDGYYTLRADQRGSVDEPQESEARAGYAGGRIDLDEITTATVRVGTFKEERENGTLQATNETRIHNASLRIVREDAEGDGFEVTLYGTDRRFENQFTSVADDRESEAPVLYQYNVPSDALGATAMVRESLAFGGVLEAGADVRLLDGETNERYFRPAEAFLRERTAGGKQVLAGLFGEYTTEPLAAVRLTGGVRLDYLRNRAGERTERALDTGEVLLDETFAPRDHWVFNGRLGAVWDVSDQTTLRAAGYTGFRMPTINELYRPYRIGSDIFEANPALEPERLYGLEAGVKWRPAENLTLEGGLFANWLHNAVANVQVTDAPGFNGELGVFVPGGGSLSQRRNLDRVSAYGFEAGVDWQPAPAWAVRLDYLLSESEVGRAPNQPELVGKRLPQTARHQGSLTLAWTPEGTPFRARITVYGSSKQYDDTLEARPLDGYVTADAFLGYRLSEGLELYATAENLFDTEIETGKGSDGLVSIGRPFLASVGIRAAF